MGCEIGVLLSVDSYHHNCTTEYEVEQVDEREERSHDLPWTHHLGDEHDHDSKTQDDGEAECTQ